MAISKEAKIKILRDKINQTEALMYDQEIELRVAKKVRNEQSEQKITETLKNLEISLDLYRGELDKETKSGE